MPQPTFDALLDSIRSIASQVAAPHADDVDRSARFPSETVEALKQHRLLSAPIPQALGGSGLTMMQLGQLVSALAQACGSSAMVLAMHYIQVACVARHLQGVSDLHDLLTRAAAEQWLFASITSEVGTFGDTRSSICAVEPTDTGIVLDKEATTGSYCAHADVLAVTARRAADASANDQVLVILTRGDFELAQTTTWDTMGMRGTCSPGFSLKSRGKNWQVMPTPYADISAQTMVPYSHILWSALWTGLASDAYGRAAAFVRGQARKNPGHTPPTAQMLAELSAHVQTMRSHWQQVAGDFDALATRPQSGEELGRMGWALRFNNLKITASTMAPQAVHAALQIVGILGYKNDSPYSLSRVYRDALSGSLMISNERIAAKSAAMLLVHKADAE